MRGLVATITFLCACTQTVGGTGVEEPERTVRDVTVEGNDEISDKTIVGGLANKKPTGILLRSRFVYDPLALQLDIERIERYYRTRGYFSADVTGTRVVPVGADKVDIFFALVEGEPTRVTNVTVSGVPDPVAWPEVAGAIAPLDQEGRIYDQDEYLLAKKRLQKLLFERGYAHVQVQGRSLIDRDTHTARVSFDVDAGPLVRFGEIRVEGNERVPDSAVLNRVAWERGEVFDPEMLELTKGRLYKLGNFSSVRMDFERTGRPAETDIIVRVNEGFRNQVQLGGGVAADEENWQIRARASFTRYAFLRPLTTLRADARPAYLFQRGAASNTGIGGEARLALEHNDFLAPRLQLNHWVDYDQTELESYATRGPGARAELIRPLFTDRLSLGAGWEIHQFNFFNVSCAIRGDPDNCDADAGEVPVIDEMLRQELGFETGYRVAYFDQAIAYDQRDDLLDPHRGYYLELRLEESGPWAGSDFDYVRGSGEARGYVPVHPRLVLASKVRYGRALRGDLPITRRFYAGGAASHRGFAYRQLAPTVFNPADDIARLGGEELLETSFEARYDVLRFRKEWVGVVAFTDGGDVPLEEDGVSLGDLHWAVGGGLRYDTLVGPVRFDLGYRVTRTDELEYAGRWAFHFSLGEAF
jgi:translocation and assembly module TamA